jgi:hypothetical protein
MYFWSLDMSISYDQLIEKYITQIRYNVNKFRVTYIAKCFQCGLNTPFKATFFYLQVHSEHKQTMFSICHD